MSLIDFSRELVHIYARVGASVVGVAGHRRRSSSGLVWSQRLLFTTDHGLRQESEISITLPGGHQLEARLVGRDPGSDLALLEVDEDLDLPLLERAPLTPVGAIVLAVARSPEDDLGASFGVLSARSGPWRTWRGGRLESFIQPDLTLYSGYSGSVLVDTEGRLIGLNSSALSRSGPITLGLETLDRVAEALQAPPTEQPYLGVGLQGVRLTDGAGGAMVVHLDADAPAARAGVLLGDILVELAGQSVAGVEDAVEAIAGLQVGQTAPSGWIRAGQPHQLELAPEARPAPRGCCEE